MLCVHLEKQVHNSNNDKLYFLFSIFKGKKTGYKVLYRNTE